MKNLLTGIQTYMQQNFPSFIGSYISGNSTLYGPFLNLAPEVVGSNGPNPPYMTVQVFGANSDQGFFQVSTPTFYVEKPRIRFMLWDNSSSRCLTNIEAMCATMDRLQSLDLGNGESLVSVVRIQNAQNVPQPIDRQGKRLYMWFVDYDFRNVRTLGS